MQWNDTPKKRPTFRDTAPVRSSMMESRIIPPDPSERRRRVLVDLGPYAFVMLLLAIKLLYFSLCLRKSWFAPGEPFWEWIRSRPEIFSSTAASLLLLFGALPLLARGWRLSALVLINLALALLIVANLIYEDW